MDGGAAMPAAQPAAEHHGSRPTLGFPLGTALLLVVIFCLSGFFALCYHWEKLRSLRGRPSRGHQQQLPPLDALEEGSRIPQPSSPSLTSKLSPMRQVDFALETVGDWWKIGAFYLERTNQIVP
ncbi:uncharacterized protein At5g65660-like isoform X2 [Zingiber officinale]|uniref:uncharacterized protein At5g65660-like isoform X2 n=1 Tax=Zingiber officinale TaxID=94328 RepID=UPI001C4BCA9C|nr:uncharacterized protein At5g65660-like isoform X2 [Zingiber officinale]